MCNVLDCDRVSAHLGYCNKHYLQVYRYGEVRITTRDRRPAIIDGAVAKIPLGIRAKDGYAIVDKEFAYLSESNWSLTHYGYVKRSKDKMLLHRLILEAKSGEVIDHKSGDVLDNRISNLRLCGQAENSRNQSLKTNNTSGYKGVSLTSSGKWVAQVKLNYKKYYFGSYNTPEEASKVYDREAKRLHGSFARLNHG